MLLRRILQPGSSQAARLRAGGGVLPRAVAPPPLSTALRARRPLGRGNHYAALGVERDATGEVIKHAYIEIVSRTHPDRTDDPADAARFQAATQANEVLADPTARKQYDSTLTAPPKPNAAPQHVPTETVAEAELRHLVQSGDVDGAVAKWAARGSSLKLLMTLIELCRKAARVPEDLPGLLDKLHATDGLLQEDGGFVSSQANPVVSTERAVQAFVERKTRAYNELIRLTDSVGTRKQLFTVLDEIDKRRIPLDMDTFMVLEEAFGWKGN